MSAAKAVGQFEGTAIFTQMSNGPYLVTFRNLDGEIAEGRLEGVELVDDAVARLVARQEENIRELHHIVRTTRNRAAHDQLRAGLQGEN
jgi:hypothetical protein